MPSTPKLTPHEEAVAAKLVGHVLAMAEAAIDHRSQAGASAEATVGLNSNLTTLRTWLVEQQSGSLTEDYPRTLEVASLAICIGAIFVGSRVSELTADIESLFKLMPESTEWELLIDADADSFTKARLEKLFDVGKDKILQGIPLTSAEVDDFGSLVTPAITKKLKSIVSQMRDEAEAIAPPPLKLIAAYQDTEAALSYIPGIFREMPNEPVRHKNRAAANLSIYILSRAQRLVYASIEETVNEYHAHWQAYTVYWTQTELLRAKVLAKTI